MKFIIDMSEGDFYSIRSGALYAIGHDRYDDIVTDAFKQGTPYEDRPQGEWINHRNDHGHNIVDCSLCGKTMQWHDEDEDGVPRYCWYCGAKMHQD